MDITDVPYSCVHIWLFSPLVRDAISKININTLVVIYISFQMPVLINVSVRTNCNIFFHKPLRTVDVTIELNSLFHSKTFDELVSFGWQYLPIWSLRIVQRLISRVRIIPPYIRITCVNYDYFKFIYMFSLICRMVTLYGLYL